MRTIKRSCVREQIADPAKISNFLKFLKQNLDPEFKRPWSKFDFNFLEVESEQQK
jgi:hypothetical protein